MYAAKEFSRANSLPLQGKLLQVGAPDRVAMVATALSALVTIVGISLASYFGRA